MHYFFLLFHTFVSENTLLASFELLKFIVGSRAPADGNKTNGNGSFIPESQIMPPLLFFYSSASVPRISNCFSFSNWLKYV